MTKQEREKLRELAMLPKSTHLVHFWADMIALLDHIDALEGQIEALQNGDLPISMSVYFMHDGHWFTRLKGDTLDEILAHANEIESGPDGSYGSLCPITLLRGDREIRRVGQMIHARGSNHSKNEWTKGLAEWKAAAAADGDIQRILKAAIASAPEVK